MQGGLSLPGVRHFLKGKEGWGRGGTTFGRPPSTSANQGPGRLGDAVCLPRKDRKWSLGDLRSPCNNLSSGHPVAELPFLRSPALLDGQPTPHPTGPGASCLLEMQRALHGQPPGI